MSTFRQTCTQRVTGRRFRYRRALQIVNRNEYLSATDLGDIKRQGQSSAYIDSKDRVKRSVDQIKKEIAETKEEDFLMEDMLEARVIFKNNKK